MIKLKSIIEEGIITESIYDKGVYKCIFFAGIPGSGKSYTSQKILGGTISPRVVNFDKYAEFIGKTKMSKDYDVGRNDFPFIDKTKIMTVKQLALYINGMLPLMVDSTSNKMNRVLMRNGILKQFGYDTGMVWINTDLNKALERIKQRNRSVPEEYVKDVHESLKQNIPYYKNEFNNFFIEINNNDGELNDMVLKAASKKCDSFFGSPINNPIGVRNIEIAKKTSGYLTPNIYRSIGDIEHRISNWY